MYFTHMYGCAHVGFFLKINLAIKQLKIHTVLSFLGKNKVYVLCLL